MTAESRLKGGILAAGRGERLRDCGPFKPLVEINRRPLISYVLDTFAETGVADVTVIINETSTAVRDRITADHWPFVIRWIVETTPSSMHSFLRLVEELVRDGAGPFLISTVDTILPRAGLGAFCEAALLRRDDAVTLAVNQPTDDDNPLWVACDESQRVTALGEAAAADATLATAGVYLVKPEILLEAEAAKRDGVFSLRAFLDRLLKRGFQISAISIGNSVDVDCAADIIAAEKLLDPTHT